MTSWYIYRDQKHIFNPFL